MRKLNPTLKIFILVIIFISSINASESIICKVKNGVDIESISQKVGVDIENIKDLGSNLYLIEFSSNKSAKLISQEISKKDGIIYAYPNETKKVIRR